MFDRLVTSLLSGTIRDHSRSSRHPMSLNVILNIKFHHPLKVYIWQSLQLSLNIEIPAVDAEC